MSSNDKIQETTGSPAMNAFADAIGEVYERFSGQMPSPEAVAVASAMVGSMLAQALEAGAPLEQVLLTLHSNVACALRLNPTEYFDAISSFVAFVRATEQPEAAPQ